MTVKDILVEVKKQFEDGNATEQGEPQACVALDNKRSIEVTLEKEGLKEADWFYSVSLHCNESEYDNGDFECTCGVIDRYCSNSTDIAEIEPLIESALSCNKLYPVAPYNLLVKTEVLLYDDGKEYDLGRAVKKDVFLKPLSKEEALQAFDAGKRVYFIYEDNRIYHTNCRKVCKDRDYLKDHYDCYNEVCGILTKS